MFVRIPPLFRCYHRYRPGTLKWYTDPVIGVGSLVAPTPPTITVGATTYYVSQTSADGCESDRASITFTVLPLPVVPTVAAGPLFYCQDATPSPLVATAAGTLNWYTTLTGTVPLVSPVPSTSLAGSATYYVSQTDGNGCESARASVIVITSSRPALPAVVLPPAYCLNAVPASLSATAVSGNTLRWYGTDETGGTASVTPSVPATNSAGVFRYYVSQVDGNGCESFRTAITVTVNARPVAPTTLPIGICQDAPVPLITSAVSAVGSLTWYTSPTGTGATVTPTLSSGTVGATTYYVTQTDGNGCESSQSPVLVTVKPLPPAPLVAPGPLVLCQSSVAAPLSATGTGTLVWYDPAGNSFSSLTPPTTTVAPSTYKVSQIVDGCEGPTASITVIVIAKPNLPTLTVPGPYCQFEAPAQLSATGLNLKWFTDPVGGTSSAVAPTPSTSTPGITTYYVTQTDGNGCESDRAPIAVRVKVKPAPPGTAPISFCANQVTALTATTVTGGTLTWYGTDPIAGPPTSTAPVPGTTVIGAPVLYYVSQTLEGCESDKVAIAVTILGSPVAPTVSAAPVVYCQGAASLPLSATGTGTLSWYTVQTGGTASAVAPVPQTGNPTTTYYYVSQTVNGCEGPRATIAVTINPKPVAPLVTPSLVYCQNASATILSATASGVLRWYADATGSTVIPTPIPSTATPGVTTYYVSQIDGNGCESDRASIAVSVVATPVAPATTTFILCQNSVSVPLTATPAAGGVLNWYTGPSGGVGSSAAPTPSTAQDGTFTYYVSQSISGCEGPRVPVTAIVKPMPTAPSVTSTLINTCLNAPPVALGATPSGGGTLNWYTSQSGGVSTSTAPLPPTNQEGTLMYYVSQTVNGCEGSRTAITVVVRGLPVAPGVSATPIVYCQGNTAVALTATPTTGATLNWYNSLPGSVASTVAPTPSTTTTGIFTYYVSQSINGCEGPKAPIVVLIQATPTAPSVGSGQLYCQGGAATPVSATASPGGVLNWYTTPTGGNSSLTPPTPALTSTGTVLYYVSQSINGCEGPRATVTVTIKSAPPAPTVAASPAFCQGTAASQLVAIPSPGGTLSWYTAQTGGSGSSVAPIPATSSAGTVVYYVSQTDITGCESNRASVTVKINALPTSPTTASVSYCQGATAVPLSALANNGSTLNWYTAQAGGTASSVAPVPVTTSAGVNTYFVSQTDANGCESTRSLLLVVISATPAAPSVTPLAPVCQNSVPIVLQAAGQNLKWYADATSANSIGNSITVSTAQAGPYSYYVSQTVNQCESPRALVQGVVNALPLPPTVANINVCQDAPTQPLTAVGTALQWFDSNDSPISVPTPVTKVDVNQTYIYKVSQTVSGCTSAKATMIYTVNVTPPPTVVTPVAYCQNAVARPLQATGSSLRWYSPTGAVTTVAPTPPTTVITAGASYSVSQLNTLGCESRKSEIKVTINALPTARLEGTTAVSLGNSAILSLTLTGTGPYSYVLSDGAVGTAETSASSDITVSKITVTPSTTTSYSVVSVTNACGNGTVSGVATVSVQVPSILTGVLGSSSICTGTLLTVPFLTSGKFTAANTFVVEIAGATGDSLSRRYTPIANGLLQGNTIVTTIPNTVAAGLYYIRVSATNAPYAVPGIRSPTLLTVKALPTASFSASKRLIYKGESTDLLFTLSGDAPWSVSYTAGSEGRSVSATKNLFPVSVSPTATTTYKLWSVSNSCGVGRVEGVDTTTIRVDVLLAEADPFGNSVKVYPVPADEVVTVDIDLPLQKEPAQLQLIGFDGHVAEQLLTRQKQTILPLDKVSAGTYLLHITIGNKTTVRKVLKR
ncbi:T9SS type A sorting domain-containing protein [Spirosoma sp.]|uniref:Ig-like domain-containing protein n=1 Tax=Spirosoma sp. TaxID=1899569 RepID=UPI0026319A4A|nr:T9SS type A sorting domain-containing protein [Spirosoma sp.]MCX6218222.1 T9SS type A sorting domain-containing protein [Spirosoma sp.]